MNVSAHEKIVTHRKSETHEAREPLNVRHMRRDGRPRAPAHHDHGAVPGAVPDLPDLVQGRGHHLVEVEANPRPLRLLATRGLHVDDDNLAETPELVVPELHPGADGFVLSLIRSGCGRGHDYDRVIGQPRHPPRGQASLHRVPGPPEKQQVRKICFDQSEASIQIT